MGIQAPAEVKYRLIREAVRQDGNRLNISELCRIAGVSRSGYYAWLDAAPLRQQREESDSRDFALVKKAYEFRGYKKGARSIYMRLLHLNPPVNMNIKKIRRLMKKYELFCPIRGANPYFASPGLSMILLLIWKYPPGLNLHEIVSGIYPIVFSR